MSTNNEALPMGVQMVGMGTVPMMGLAMGGMPMQAMQMQAMPMQPMAMMTAMAAPAPMAPVIPCRISCEMTTDGMTVKFKALDAQSMGVLKERCDAWSALSAMSAATAISCGSMPLLVCTPTPNR